MIPDPAALALFMAAALALNVTPGPDMLYVLGNSVGRGRRAGVVSALGVGAGTIVHIGAAAFGLSALLTSSALAYEAISYAGAAYLLYLGVRALAGGGPAPESRLQSRGGLGTVFRQGAITNILNPKVALFFLAFIPQFVDPSRGSVVPQFIFLGLLFDTSGTLVNTAVALMASSLRDRMGRGSTASRVQRWFTGSLFLALGARLAVQR